VRAVAVLIAVAVASSAAQAETGITRSGRVCWLIRDERVQRELKLTETQCEEAYSITERSHELIVKIIKDHMAKKEGPDRKNDGEAEARINADRYAALAKVLTREQFARYEQIRLQHLREEALLEPAVQKAIKLDDARAKKLASIFLEYLEFYDQLVVTRNKLPLKESLRTASSSILTYTKRRDESLKQMRELLTDEQHAAFEALKGPVFRIEGRAQLGDPMRQVPLPKKLRDRFLKSLSPDSGSRGHRNRARIATHYIQII
jgi:hypothetical protein